MENENKKPLHLTITDNRTGETVRDLDFDCLIGAVHLSAGESGGLFIARGTTLAQAETVCAAEATVAHALRKDPMLCLAKGIINAEAVEKITEETEN